MYRIPYVGDMATHTILHTSRSHAGASGALSALALAEAVVADGFDAHEDDVAALVADARLLDVCEMLGAVALDRREATVVRERALGRLVVAYTRAIDGEATVETEPVGERFTVAA